MSSRVQTALLALLAVVAAGLTALALRTPTPDEPAALAVAGPSPLPVASQLPVAVVVPTSSPPVRLRALQATRGRPEPVVAFAGDSYVVGLGASAPAKTGYVALLADRLGWRTKAVGLPGTGYLEAAAGPTVVETVRRLGLPALRPDLVVLQAGHNDVTLPATQVARRVQEAVGLVRTLAPRTRVVVVGVLWPTFPPAGAAAVDQAIRAGAQASGASFVDTFDLRFTAPRPANRPDDAGYAAIARRLQASFRELGLVAQ